jgi:dihydrolipoamide dehydrogenase
MAKDTYDLIVIGAGTTGENVAARAAAGGLSAVAVEAELVGGDCSYWACVPSKALLRPPEALEAARSVEGARQAVTGLLDVDAVLGRRDAFTGHWDDSGQVQWLQGASVDLVRGHGRLVGERRVDVNTPEGEMVTLTARHAVALCTGSEAAIPPIPGLAEARPWTPREATSAKRVPDHLVIIGGGVAGCELATAFRAFGAEVSVLEVLPRLLGTFEPFVGEWIAKAFTERGINVRTGIEVSQVHRDGGEGPVTLTLSDGSTLTADQILVAAGRKPRTEDLGLETIGLTPGTWLEVDDTVRVKGVEGGWLYAGGDLNHRALLTHMGKYQARACGDVIAARARGAPVTNPAPWSRYTATADHWAIPQVAFTEPQVAAVGRTQAQGREAGLEVKVVDYPMGNVAGAALYADGYTGHAQLVVDERRRVVVGATFLGPVAGELVHSATIAVVGEVPLDRLWHAVPSFPTISEVWLRLLEAYGL